MVQMDNRKHLSLYGSFIKGTPTLAAGLLLMDILQPMLKTSVSVDVQQICIYESRFI